MEVNAIWTYIDQLYAKQVSFTGKYGDKAQDNAICEVSITDVSFEGLARDFVQQSGELTCAFCGDFNGPYRIGDCDTNVGRALERCLQSMQPEEVCVAVFYVRRDWELEENALGMIRCQVKLNTVANNRPVFELQGEEKYRLASENKEKGVELYKNGRVVDAFLRFNKSLRYLLTIDLEVDGLLLSRVSDLSVYLYNNIASCQLKRGNLPHVVNLCSKVLAVQPGNVKALYRRAVARTELGELNEATSDLQQVLEVEPGNVAAATKLGQLRRKASEVNANYASVVKRMFEL